MPMNEKFLAEFLSAVLHITHAQRGLVVDLDRNIVVTANIEPALLESPQFRETVHECVRGAVEKQETVVANNVIKDLAEAPTTNTGFSDLRVIVAIPLAGYGAVYFDQHISSGMIPRTLIDSVTCLVGQVFPAGDYTLNREALVALHEQACLPAQ